jgi:uncharacterized small protein (DUF1192 family)
MRVLLVVVLVLFMVSVAWAQQPTAPSESVVNAQMRMLQSQRDEANNRIVLLAGQVAELSEKIATLEKEIKTLKPAEPKK